MTNQYDDALYRNPDLVRFYDMDNEWRADFDVYLARAASAARILDLGCGTGTLMAAIAAAYPHKTLAGADPAQAMLAIAQQKTDSVRWVCSSAENLDLDITFDLIILSGHAFQVFLTREQRIAALQTIQRHLSPDGIVLFDSRNPQTEEWREWTPEQTRETRISDEFGDIISWNDVTEHDGFIRYSTFYQMGENGQTFSAVSDIAFPSFAEICDAVEYSGLTISRVCGDWQHSPFQPGSPEMVFELCHPGHTQTCAA